MSTPYYPPPPGPPPPQTYGAPVGEAQSYYNNAPPPQNNNPFATSYKPAPSEPLKDQYEMNNNQQQYYAQQQPIPNEPPPPYTTFEETFAVPKKKYNDVWAAILFAATFFGLVVVSVLSLRGYAQARGTTGTGIYDNNANNFGLSSNTLILFAFVAGLSGVLGYAYLLLTRKFTKQVIWATGIFTVLTGLGTAIYYLYRKNYVSGVIFLVFTAFYAWCFWSWRSRIPFTVVMLEQTIDVARNYGHIFLLSLLGGIVALVLAAWFSLTTVAIYVKYTPNQNNPACRVSGGGCSNGKVIGLLVFTVFGFYWVSEVLKNVLHTSVSGVYGSWYFCSRNQMPRNPTLGAFKRSVTTSFGSICFGSLIVAFIQFLRRVCSIAQQDAAQDGNIGMVILFCILRCLIGILEWLVEFFNKYAYSYIALYGDAYVSAAKATWKMMRDRGWDALVQDCLVDPVLSSGSVFVGYLCALLSYLYLQFTNPVYNQNGGYTVIIMAFSFLIGLQVSSIFLTPLGSGVATLFVSMAHNPEVLQRDHPAFYQRLVAVYPQVQHAVNQGHA